MTTTDEETLCSFVVWRLRSGDLPRSVADAAFRLSGRVPRCTVGGGHHEASFSVSGVRRDEDSVDGAVSDWQPCFSVDDALDRADDLLATGFDYVLIERSFRE